MADGAVLALCQAGFGAGGGDGLVDDHRMPGGGDGLLRDQHFAADRTVLSFGQAGFGAGGGDGFVDGLRVACGRNRFLFNEIPSADHAEFAFGDAVLRAGRGFAGALLRQMGREAVQLHGQPQHEPRVGRRDRLVPVKVAAGKEGFVHVMLQPDGLPQDETRVRGGNAAVPVQIAPHGAGLRLLREGRDTAQRRQNKDGQ